MNRETLHHWILEAATSVAVQHPSTGNMVCVCQPFSINVTLSDRHGNSHHNMAIVLLWVWHQWYGTYSTGLSGFLDYLANQDDVPPMKIVTHQAKRMIRGQIFKIQFLIDPASPCHKKSDTEKNSEKVLLVAQLRAFLYHKVTYTILPHFQGILPGIPGKSLFPRRSSF